MSQPPQPPQPQSAESSPLTPLEDEENSGDIEPEMIVLSIKRTGDSRPIPLLCIPPRIIGFFSTKPRKWLMYVATVTCGVDGTLRYAGSEEDMSEGDIESEVKGGDHFVFHLSGEPKFVDWRLRDGLRSRASVTTESREAPEELKDYYRGCPFTKEDIDMCQGCHFVPFAKGTEYLRDVLRLRGEPDDEITISSNQNMIVLSASRHTAFDKHLIGFLKTPNRFLKTNEITGLENEDAQSYRVTLHYFVDNDRKRPSFSHGNHSDLTKGSGLDYQITPQDYNPDDYRPKDVLLDLAYVVGLLTHWSHKEGADLLADDSKRRYGETVKRGEDLEGQQMEEERRRRREESNTRRDARTLRRSAGIPAPKDGYGFIFRMHCWARNTTPEQFKAEIEQHHREAERNITERVETWAEETCASSGDLEDPEPSIISPDDDGEIPVSVEDALSRSGPRYPIRSMPSLTHSTSTDSDELGVVSDPKPYEGSEDAEVVSNSKGWSMVHDLRGRDKSWDLSKEAKRGEKRRYESPGEDPIATHSN